MSQKDYLPINKNNCKISLKSFPNGSLFSAALRNDEQSLAGMLDGWC